MKINEYREVLPTIRAQQALSEVTGEDEMIAEMLGEYQASLQKVFVMVGDNDFRKFPNASDTLDQYSWQRAAQVLTEQKREPMRANLKLSSMRAKK